MREISEKFDKWNPPAFRLSEQEIESSCRSSPDKNIDDIKLAQAQVCNFAQAQRSALKDVEVETLPGVVLGHKNMPAASVGCYVPGGEYPLVASAHMSMVTAKVAGVPRVIAASPPYHGKPSPAVMEIVMRQVDRERILNISGLPGLVCDYTAGTTEPERPSRRRHPCAGSG